MKVGKNGQGAWVQIKLQLTNDPRYSFYGLTLSNQPATNLMKSPLRSEGFRSELSENLDCLNET